MGLVGITVTAVVQEGVRRKRRNEVGVRCEGNGSAHSSDPPRAREVDLKPWSIDLMGVQCSAVQCSRQSRRESEPQSKPIP
jgi:hypothetical protein